MMPGGDWSDSENDAVVADYFAMLIAELAGQSYNKTAHRRHLTTALNRGEGSVEFKHQNISAVLLGLGHPWIDGYKPASNFQGSLVDAVLRYLRDQPDWLPERGVSELAKPMMRDEPQLWIGPAPTHSNMPPALDLAKVSALSSKFDVAERDARNRKLGQAGEQRVLENERAILRSAGRADLATKVRWVSMEDGDGAGYDIASFDPGGTPRWIEVKTTNGWERTPFHLTRNEIAVAEANRNIRQLIRIWNFARVPKSYSIRPPLEAHVALTPTSFLASLH
jgi:Domain of unknown function (DUF3883)